MSTIKTSYYTVINGKFLSPTNTQGARYKLSAQEKKPKVYGYGCTSSHDERIKKIVSDYLKFLEWDDSSEWIIGTTESGFVAVRNK